LGGFGAELLIERPFAMSIARFHFVFAAALLLVLAGCADHSDFKVTTAKTPASRAGERPVFSDIVPLIDTCGVQSVAGASIKAGFVYVGRVGDFGFTYAQNQGRLALMRELGVQTMVRETVYGDENVVRVIQEMIDSGATVIFSTSLGFMKPTAMMAERNPGIYFFHCSGGKTKENMSAYFGRMYQMRYLTGVVAGLRTKTNKIGYVAAYPIPEVIRGVNAFALGVRSVNPQASVEMRWTNSWVDIGLARELTHSLIRSGCDVIAQHHDSQHPQITAEEMGVWSIGYNSPMGFFAPNAYLTGAVWDWGPYMVDQVRRIKRGQWRSSNYWGGIEDGVVKLEPLTKNVAPGTQEAVDAATRRMERGFEVFVGPLYDNRGVLRVPDGVTMTDGEKLAIDWFVGNILDNVD
jgi:basic membrane protein A